MTAKHPGECPLCHCKIVPGDTIYWSRGKPAWHEDCERAKMRDDMCPACSGYGRTWNNAPCRCCDGTGNRAVYDFAKAGGHPRKDHATTEGGAA